ncbi:hypothetical protein Dimus_020230 [Dionaea muscipula]
MVGKRGRPRKIQVLPRGSDGSVKELGAGRGLPSIQEVGLPNDSEVSDSVSVPPIVELEGGKSDDQNPVRGSQRDRVQWGDEIEGVEGTLIGCNQGASGLADPGLMPSRYLAAVERGCAQKGFALHQASTTEGRLEILDLESNERGTPMAKLRRTCLAAVVYFLWQERNARVFCLLAADPVVVSKKALRFVEECNA